MAKLTLRKLHRTLAPIVLLPLFVTVKTGVTYRLGIGSGFRGMKFIF